MTSDAPCPSPLHLRYLGDLITQILGSDLQGTVTVVDYGRGRITLHVSAGDEALIRENTPRLIHQLRQFGLEAVTAIKLVPPPPPSVTHRTGPGPGLLLNDSGKVHTNRKGRGKKSDKDEGKKEEGGEAEEETITVAELLRLAAKRERLLAVVKGLLDERVSRHIVGTDYHADGELVILCESPAWATQLRFLQRSLIPALAAKGMTVREVAVRVMPPSEERPAPPPTPATPMSEETVSIIEQIAAHTSDPDLSAALLRLAKHRRPNK